jgi:hypothetical protein
MTSGSEPVFGDRRHYEQALMRVGRRLQSLGQLLEQDPTRLAARGFTSDESVTGPRPLLIEMDELRGYFDPATAQNVGRLLSEYHALLAREKTSP